jgi:hypothetical protein
MTTGNNFSSFLLAILNFVVTISQNDIVHIHIFIYVVTLLLKARIVK